MGLRIGIIGGNGWIGGAIARAAVGAGARPARRSHLSCRSAPPGWLPEAHWTHDNQALADRSDRRHPLRPPAGLACDRARGAGQASRLGHGRGDARRHRRASRDAARRPGAAERRGRGWPLLHAVDRGRRGHRRRPRHRAAALDAFGTGDEVATEAEIDYMTGLSGTGPAYPGAPRRGDDARCRRPRPAARCRAARGGRDAGRHRTPLREERREPGGHRRRLRRLPGRHRRRHRGDAGARLRGRGLGGPRRGAREVARPVPPP